MEIKEQRVLIDGENGNKIGATISYTDSTKKRFFMKLPRFPRICTALSVCPETFL